MAALVAFLALAALVGALAPAEAQYYRALTPAEDAELAELSALNTGYLRGPW